MFSKVYGESSYIDMLKARDLKIQKGPTLRKRGVVKRSPMKGDVVLLLNDKNKISNLSRIVDVVKSGDKKVRAVKVIHGINREATWWPIRKVSFLEVGDPNTVPNKFSEKNIPRACKYSHKKI